MRDSVNLSASHEVDILSVEEERADSTIFANLRCLLSGGTGSLILFSWDFAVCRKPIPP